MTERDMFSNKSIVHLQPLPEQNNQMSVFAHLHIIWKYLNHQKGFHRILIPIFLWIFQV